MGASSAENEPISGRAVVAREEVLALRAAILKAQCAYLGLFGEGILPEVPSNKKFPLRGVVTLVVPDSLSSGTSLSLGEMFSIQGEIKKWVQEEGTPPCTQCQGPSQRRSVDDAVRHFHTSEGTIVVGVPLDPGANLGALSVLEVAEMFDATRVLLGDQMCNLATDKAAGDRIVGALDCHFVILLSSFVTPLSREEHRRFEQVVQSAFTHGVTQVEVVLLRKNSVHQRITVGASSFHCSGCGHSVKPESESLDRWSIQGQTLSALLDLSSEGLYALCAERNFGARVKSINEALGLVKLSQVPLSRTVSSLASGEQIRVRLAQLLVDGFSDATIVIDDPVARGPRHDECIEAISAALIARQRMTMIRVEPLSRTKEHHSLVRETVQVSSDGQVSLSLTPHRLIWLEGESGSGKSLLLREVARAHGAHVRAIRARADEITPRDRIADLLGVTEAFIREAVATYEARSSGVSAAYFSRSRGAYRCSHCKGDGWTRPATDDSRVDALIQHCMPQFLVKCPICEGVGLSGTSVNLRVYDTTFDELLKCTVKEGRDRLSLVDDVREVLDAVIECGGESWILGDSVLLRAEIYSPRIELAMLYRKLKQVSRKKRGAGIGDDLLLLIELESVDQDIVQVLRTVASLCRGCIVDAGSPCFQADGDCSILLTARERELLLASSASSKGVQLTWHERH